MHGDNLPNKAEVLNLGSQEMFLEEILMNELAHEKRLGQTYLSRLEIRCEGSDPRQHHHPITVPHSNCYPHDTFPGWITERVIMGVSKERNHVQKVAASLVTKIFQNTVLHF